MISKAHSLITDEQKLQYRERGYCIVPGLFSEDEIQDIENFFEDFKLRGEKVYDGNAFDEVDPTKGQLRAMHPHRYDSRAAGWMLHPNVGAVLEELLGKPALGVQTMYYFKPPGGKGQGMHQDNIYLATKPATCIAAWTAIDTADLDNGCLWVVPGSHRDNIICPDRTANKKDTWLNYGDSHIFKFPRDQKPEPVIVKRGETMFFGGNLIHGSGPNRTKDRFRRTFIGHYIDEASEEVSKFYFPVLNMQGEVVSHVAATTDGGPCGAEFLPKIH
jgi:phytanoyl-CoA hydroxylase